MAGLAAELKERSEPLILRVTLAVLVILAVAPFAQEALAGKSDVPAAAMVATCAWLGLRRRQTLPAATVLATAVLAGFLTKATTILPIAGVGLWLLLDQSRPRRARLWSAAPIAIGGILGLGYLAIVADRFHMWLVPFLRYGTGGLWAERAAATRTDALLRLDVLGDGLRLPLAFALVYGSLRVIGLRHRLAAVSAIVGGLVWSIAGTYAASGAIGPFATWQDSSTLIGFALVLTLSAVARNDEAPSRSNIALLLLIAAPPLAVWVYSTPYFTRLAATAWPGLAILLAMCLTPAIRTLSRFNWMLAVAPLTVLMTAGWMSVSTLDGLHGYQWVEYRALGTNGVWNKERTTNIVLPSVQSALTVIEPHLGSHGLLLVSDPRFSFFLPNRVDTRVALSCSDLRGDSVFVLLTSDEAEQLARDAGGLATPEQWAQCSSPKLQQLSDGADGFVVFVTKS